MERLEGKQCRPSITQTANLERLPHVPASFFTSIITPRPPPTRLSPHPTHRPAPDTNHRRFINYGFCLLCLLLPCRRIQQHRSCHPRGAAQLGQGSSTCFLLREELPPLRRGRGGMEVGCGSLRLQRDAGKQSRGV